MTDETPSNFFSPIPEVSRDEHADHVIIVIGQGDDARCARLDPRDALEMARQIKYHAERLLEPEQST